ncbi:MAG: hypothetical protein ACXACC_09275, partial [Promethearchaeota archaeon]
MKLHFSISLKLTLIVVAVSAVVIFSLTLYNINEQAISFDNIYVDKAKDVGKFFDIYLATVNNHNEINQLIHEINESKEIQQIDIYFKQENTLRKIYSTHNNSLNVAFDSYINLSVDTKKQCKIPFYTDNHYNLTVITPMNSTMNLSGAYVFHFNIDESFQAFQTKTNNLIIISTLSLFILIFSFLFLIRKTIVTPIINF